MLGEADAVQVIHERLEFWPFTEGELLGDLRAAGLEARASTYAPDADRYLVRAQASSRRR